MDTIFWLSPSIESCNWIDFISVAYASWYHWNCGRTQRKAAAINQFACPSYSLYVQLLWYPMYYPGGMKARVSPVQWSKPHSILAPTQDSNPGSRIQNHKWWPLHYFAGQMLQGANNRIWTMANLEGRVQPELHIQPWRYRTHRNGWSWLESLGSHRDARQTSGYSRLESKWTNAMQ